MPVSYSIDAEKKLIRTTCSRPLTFAEVIEHFRTLREDPACSGRLDVLLNVSDADALPQSGQLGAVNMELRALRKKVQLGACAVVATRDAMFGMMRMFEAHSGDYFSAMHVFRDAAQAEQWLGSQEKASREKEVSPEQ
jgi:hypothetical protein